MKIVLTCFLLFEFLFSEAGDLKYPVTTIPEELKQNVDVVVRDEQCVFKILSRNSAIWHVREVHKIFNEKGKWAAEKYIFYDKLTKITDINAVVYDASGNQTKKLRNKDIGDHAAVDNGTLFSDDRVKVIDLSQT